MIRPRMIVIAAATMIALSGCGGSSGDKPKSAPRPDLSKLSATALLAKAKGQIEKAPAVTIKGTGDDGGTKIAMDLSYVGDDASGTVTLAGDEMTLLKVGKTTYIKATDDFWKANAADQASAIITVVNGRWIKAGSDSDFADLVSLTERSFLTDQVLSPEGKVATGPAKTIDGVKCLALVDGTDGTLYVASDDARPVRLVSNKGGGGVLNFAYDSVDAPVAPGSSDVIDFSELMGGA